jgi:hypothetical protein
VHTVYIANMISFVIAYSFEISATAFFLPRAHFGHYPKSNIIIPWALFKKFPFFVISLTLYEVGEIRSQRNDPAFPSSLSSRSVQSVESVRDVNTCNMDLHTNQTS